MTSGTFGTLQAKFLVLYKANFIFDIIEHNAKSLRNNAAPYIKHAKFNSQNHLSGTEAYESNYNWEITMFCCTSN